MKNNGLFIYFNGISLLIIKIRSEFILDLLHKSHTNDGKLENRKKYARTNGYILKLGITVPFG